MHQIAASNCFIGPLRDGVLVSQHRNSVHLECSTFAARHYTLAILTIIVSGCHQAQHFRQCRLQKLTQRAGHGFSVGFRARLGLRLPSVSIYLSLLLDEACRLQPAWRRGRGKIVPIAIQSSFPTNELDNRQALLQINSFSSEDRADKSSADSTPSLNPSRQ